MAKKSVQKRVQAKRDAEKAARKRQGRVRKIRVWVSTVGAIGLVILLYFLFTGGKETNPLAQQSASPSVSTSPGVNAGCTTNKPGAYRGKTYKSRPAYSVNREKKYTATMETSCGQVIIELLPKSAPKTVSNFVFLSRAGFFDGLLFHRVIPDFMIQGGDPQGTGSGDPGYKFEDEIDPAVKFDKPGLLAMANSGPDTNGSQFFITDSMPAHLNGKHTIFGRVLKGQDVVKKIINVQRDAQDKPLTPVYILKITITET